MPKLAQESGWPFHVKEDTRNVAARLKAKGIMLIKESHLQVLASLSL